MNIIQPELKNKTEMHKRVECKQHFKQNGLAKIGY